MVRKTGEIFYNPVLQADKDTNPEISVFLFLWHISSEPDLKRRISFLWPH